MGIRLPHVLRLLVFILIAAAWGNFRGLCQPPLNLNGAQNGLPLPRLCMPVKYREAPATDPIRTRIGVLGDRYHEVRQALAGWNESGVPLVGRINSAWQPVPCGDDAGLFYLVPLIARKTGLSANASLDLFLCGLILAAAIAALSGLWLDMFGMRHRLFSLVPVLVGSWLSYKVGDVYVVQATLPLALIPWLIRGLNAQISSQRRFLIVFVAGILLGFGQWIRTQSATAPLIFFAVLLWFSPLRRTTRFLLGLAIFLGLSLPLLYARLPRHERDRFLARSNLIYQSPIDHHLIWHTTYLGLAYLTNPYVSAWRDSVAVEYVESIDPFAIYGGQKYEDLLRARVKEIIRHDPRFIIYTIAAKTGVLLWILVLSINFGFAAAIVRPKSPGIEIGFWVAMLSAAVPGVIALPAPSYVIGMIIFALYYWYYSICFYMESGGSLYFWSSTERKPLRRIPTDKSSMAVWSFRI